MVVTRAEFLLAVRTGDLDGVGRLLQEEGINPADEDNYVIRCAARSRHLNVVELLWKFDSIRAYYE